MATLPLPIQEFLQDTPMAKLPLPIQEFSKKTPMPNRRFGYGALKTAQQQILHFFLFRSSPRPISTSPLKALLPLHFWPIYLIFFEGPYQINSVGDLILRLASRLDAFSAYPVRTWLSSRASGETTGAPAVRPSRSSRTRDRSSQISYARDR